MAVAGSSETRPGRSERSIPPARPTEPLPCPRCFSNATKFCYYNNHSIFQPRYFCKRCRLYWTHGGALRNVPVGGATRKSTKLSARPFCSSPAVAPTVWLTPSAPTHCPMVGAGSLLGYGYGSFASFMSEPAKYLTLGGYGTSLDWLLLMYPVIARRRTGGASGSSEVASAD